MSIYGAFLKARRHGDLCGKKKMKMVGHVVGMYDNRCTQIVTGLKGRYGGKGFKGRQIRRGRDHIAQQAGNRFWDKEHESRI